MASGNNIILTGVPRSGTTLVCSLLNKLPDVVALNEPMNMRELQAAEGRAGRLGVIDSFFAEQRRSLLQMGEAVAQISNGLTDDNTFGQQDENTGLRRSVIRRETVQVNKALGADFQLAIKHPNAFTALLPELVDEFPCFAIIRHPLAVLASWHTLDIPLRDGHAPMAEAFDQTLKDKLAMTGSVLDRQLILLDWYYGRYQACLPAEYILRYEDIVESGGAALDVIHSQARDLSTTLSSRNRNTMYDGHLMTELGRALQEQAEACYWRFYSPTA